MILGVDISTSITGFAIVADDKLLYYDSVNLKKYKNFFEKAEVIKNKLMDIFEAYQCDNEFMNGDSPYPIEHIYIEQSLHMFMSGKSSAKTLSTLHRFNGVVSWLLYELFEIEPTYIGASTARKHAGVTGLRGKKAKEAVLQFLLDTEPAFKVEYTRHGNPRPESYDRADAIILAKAGWALEQKGKDQDTS